MFERMMLSRVAAATFALFIVSGSAAAAAAAPTPTVFWHGMGDSFMGMASLAKIVEDETGAYTHALKIGLTVIDDTINGFLKPVNKQIEMACRMIADDPMLSDGYHAVGLSQGGQFLRAVAQRCPQPPMKNLITFGGQHQGVFGIPRCPGESVELCNIMRELLNLGAYFEPVQSVLVQAQYWHDPLNFEQYVEKSQFLSEINNEKPVKNSTYATNLAQLTNFVMVKHAQDGMVEPRETAHFEFYEPGSETVILPLRSSPIYTEDRIGLKALDQAGKLVFLEVEGDHLQFTREWFINQIVNVYLIQ